MNRFKTSTTDLRLALSLAALLGLSSGAGLVQPVAAEADAADGFDTLSIEDLMRVEIISSASRFEERALDAPSSVTVVTAAEIQAFGYRNLADVLRGVRGFYITYERNYSNIGVRGFSRPADFNTRVLLLIDGHRNNEVAYDSASLGTELPIDIELIERIEIVRGPSSSLYGTNAFFAVINLITRRPENLKGFELSASVADQGTLQGRGSFATSLGSGLSLMASGSFYTSQGQSRLYYSEFDDPATSDGVSEENDAETAGRGFIAAAWEGFRLQAAYVSRMKEVPTASFGAVFNDSRNQTIDRRGYVDLSYKRSVSRSVELSGRLFYDYFQYDGEHAYQWDEQQPAFIVKDLGVGAAWGGAFNASVHLPGRHRLTFGAELRDNFDQDQLSRNLDSGEIYLDDQQRTMNWALYAETVLNLAAGLKLSLGSRYDHYDTFGGTINPRLGLVYSPNPETAFKLLYGHAFRAPSNFELNYSWPGFHQINHDLRPETIRSTELVWEQYIGDHVRFSALGFYNHLDGLISVSYDLDSQQRSYANAAELDSKGVELEVETRLHGGIHGRLAYTLQKTTDDETGAELSNSPRHLAKLLIDLPLIQDKLLAGFELQAMSSRGTLSGGKTSAFLVPNLTVTAKNVIEGMDLSVGLYNLSDQRYFDPASAEHRQEAIEQDGRSLRLKLTYGF